MRSPFGFNLVQDCQSCPLKSNGFFCDLPVAALKKFESIKFTMAYPQHSVLFGQGEAARGVYMLCKGRIKLSITSPQGKSLILRIAGPGDILGVASVVSGKPLLATAETLEPCQINIVSSRQFLTFIREHVTAALHAAQELSQSYEIACVQIRTLGLSQSASEKLARFLLDWTNKRQETNEGTRVMLTLTHEEIGEAIGVSRETVTRIFGEFRKKHLVGFHGAALRIRDRQGLEGLLAVKPTC